jgi:hypothetical protein
VKTFSLITLASFLLRGAAAFAAAADDTPGSTRVFNRISAETGVPVDTLREQKAATGLGYGSVENANLLANATGNSFDDIVAMHNAGQGWGKIAHDNGLNLGKLVSDAHQSTQAASQTQSLRGQTVNSRMTRGKSSGHTKSATRSGKSRTSSMKGIGREASGKFGHGTSHGMSSMSRSHGKR